MRVDLRLPEYQNRLKKHRQPCHNTGLVLLLHRQQQQQFIDVGITFSLPGRKLTTLVTTTLGRLSTILVILVSLPPSIIQRTTTQTTTNCRPFIYAEPIRSRITRPCLRRPCHLSIQVQVPTAGLPRLQENHFPIILLDCDLLIDQRGAFVGFHACNGSFCWSSFCVLARTFIGYTHASHLPTVIVRHQ